MIKSISRHREFILYYSMIGLYFLFSFYPEGRVWGLNVWGYFSLNLRLTFLGIGAVIPLVVHWFAKNDDLESNKSSRKYAVLGLLVSIGFVFLFYILRAKTYFLGDGYTLLSLLVTENVLIEKTRNLGASLLHVWLYRFLDGSSENDAILTYQSISIVSGFIFLTTAWLFVRKLFEDNYRRSLFFLGIVSGGNMLLYFGYVENYSLFTLSVLCFAMIGLLIVQNRCNRWWILLFQSLAIFFHIFGVVLIPATAYVLASDSRLTVRFQKLNKTLRLSLLAVLIVLSVAAFIYKYYTDLFFQLSIVPLFSTRFTVEGYTLFSGKHLLDMLNLVVLLLPGIVLLVALILKERMRFHFTSREIRFLLLTSALTIGAAFIFDPKLGMSRDWDLFAFSAIPLTVLIYYLVLSYGRYKLVIVTATLSITLGFITLIPRAISLTQPEIALKHFSNYQFLDKLKNRNSWNLLSSYYENQNDYYNFERVSKEWRIEYPDVEMMAQANALHYNEQKHEEAIEILHNIIGINPISVDAYAFLGVCYYDLKQYDSALTYIKIANSLSPNRLNNISNLGRVYQLKGEYDKAEREYQRALRWGYESPVLIYNLASLYRETGRMELYLEYLIRSLETEGTPKYVDVELIEYFLENNDLENASAWMQKSELLQTDSILMNQIRSHYPQWDSLLAEQEEAGE